MAVGFPLKTTYANGDVYSASDANDTNGTLNLLGASVAFAAGKNDIINGDFYVNQRGFTSTTSSGVFTFDRWQTAVAGGTSTISNQTFTAGTAPVSGYNGKSFLRLVSSGQTGASDRTSIFQYVEDSRTLGGITSTISFWAKASTGTPSVAVEFWRSYGSGGSPSGAEFLVSGKTAITSSWARYSITVAIPSLSGKTVGTTEPGFLAVGIYTSAGSNLNANTQSLGIQSATIDIWGVQLEQGSTATAFQTATGTIQGELAACQRYYARFTVNGAYGNFPALNSAWSSSNTNGTIQLPTTMRVAPTSLDYSGVWLTDFLANYTPSSVVISTATGGPDQAELVIATSGLTTYRQYRLQANNNANAYVGFSAEL
jgi:hypothetical protein